MTTDLNGRTNARQDVWLSPHLKRKFNHPPLCSYFAFLGKTLVFTLWGRDLAKRIGLPAGLI